MECEGLFCPQKFVCHSHDPKNRTCHWGFDSDNWRAYLHLADDYTDSEREKLSKIVADFKNRYKPSSVNALTTKRKTVRQKIFLLQIIITKRTFSFKHSYEYYQYNTFSTYIVLKTAIRSHLHFITVHKCRKNNKRVINYFLLHRRFLRKSCRWLYGPTIKISPDGAYFSIHHLMLFKN